jgi:hypothetical protein
MRLEDQIRHHVDDTLAALPASALAGPDDAALADGAAWLLARRVAEYQDGTFTTAEYNEAASALRLLGDDAEADRLASIAGTGAVLEHAERQWRERYRGRVPTLTEQRDQALIVSGRVRRLELRATAGIDGGVYTPAVFCGPAGILVPAVVATTHAGTVELVTFGTEAEQRSWLADRYAPAGPGGPLASCTAGPDCRVAWEERVLARLLRHGDKDGKLTALLPPDAFSTHVRSETYLALLAVPPGGTPDPEAVREKLAARLLRAPDWAAGYVGRPAGHLALAYADRLAATPVTEPRARAAVAALVREAGQETGASAQAAAGKHRRTLRSRPVRPARIPGTEPGWPRYPEAPSPGTAPRR